MNVGSLNEGADIILCQQDETHYEFKEPTTISHALSITRRPRRHFNLTFKAIRLARCMPDGSPIFAGVPLNPPPGLENTEFAFIGWLAPPLAA